MKKFGTPNGAGPGNANENVGFDADGTPFFATGGGFDEVEVVVEVLGPLGPVPPFRFGPLGPVPPFCLGPVGPVPPLCLPPEPFGLEDDEPVVVVPEDEDEEPLEPLEPVGPLGLDDAAAHEADTALTGPTPAGTICAGAVPGGTFTLNDSDCPLNNVTVTVH